MLLGLILDLPWLMAGSLRTNRGRGFLYHSSSPPTTQLNICFTWLKLLRTGNSQPRILPSSQKALFPYTRYSEIQLFYIWSVRSRSTTRGSGGLQHPIPIRRRTIVSKAWVPLWYCPNGSASRHWNSAEVSCSSINYSELKWINIAHGRRPRIPTPVIKGCRYHNAPINC